MSNPISLETKLIIAGFFFHTRFSDVTNDIPWHEVLSIINNAGEKVKSVRLDETLYLRIALKKTERGNRI